MLHSGSAFLDIRSLLHQLLLLIFTSSLNVIQFPQSLVTAAGVNVVSYPIQEFDQKSFNGGSNTNSESENPLEKFLNSRIQNQQEKQVTTTGKTNHDDIDSETQIKSGKTQQRKLIVFNSGTDTRGENQHYFILAMELAKRCRRSNGVENNLDIIIITRKSFLPLIQQIANEVFEPVTDNNNLDHSQSEADVNENLNDNLLILTSTAIEKAEQRNRGLTLDAKIRQMISNMSKPSESGTLDQAEQLRLRFQEDFEHEKLFTYPYLIELVLDFLPVIQKYQDSAQIYDEIIFTGYATCTQILMPCGLPAVAALNYDSRRNKTKPKEVSGTESDFDQNSIKLRSYINDSHKFRFTRIKGFR